MENQQDILKTVIDGLVYIPTKDMIVKPLEDEYVEKEIIKPVETGKKDENGYDINDTETVKEKVLYYVCHLGINGKMRTIILK